MESKNPASRTEISHDREKKIQSRPPDAKKNPVTTPPRPGPRKKIQSRPRPAGLRKKNPSGPAVRAPSRDWIFFWQAAKKKSVRARNSLLGAELRPAGDEAEAMAALDVTHHRPALHNLSNSLRKSSSLKSSVRPRKILSRPSKNPVTQKSCHASSPTGRRKKNPVTTPGREKKIQSRPRPGRGCEKKIQSRPRPAGLRKKIRPGRPRGLRVVTGFFGRKIQSRPRTDFSQCEKSVGFIFRTDPGALVATTK